MESKVQRALVAASIAGILAAAGGLGFGQSAQAEGEDAPCYGVNKCKGTGDCGGKGHSCAGQNACKGEGYVELDKKDCLRIEGGSLTPPSEAAQ